MGRCQCFVLRRTKQTIQYNCATKNNEEEFVVNLKMLWYFISRVSLHCVYNQLLDVKQNQKHQVFVFRG